MKKRIKQLESALKELIFDCVSNQLSVKKPKTKTVRAAQKVLNGNGSIWHTSMSKQK